MEGEEEEERVKIFKPGLRNLLTTLLLDNVKEEKDKTFFFGDANLFLGLAV